MSRPRLTISDATADHLLAGGEVDDPVVQDLAQVLSAASAPGRAEELMRENVAVAAFTAAAHLTPAARHRRRPTIKSVLVNALSLKLAAAAVAAIVGGLAFAASTGILPTPLYPEPVSSITPSNGGRTPTATPHVQPSTTPAGRLKSTGPQLTGWCTAYLNDGAAEDKNKHLDAGLVAAAGGADKVAGFCAGVVASPKTSPAGSANTSPAGSAKTSTKPRPSTPSTSPHRVAPAQTPRTEHSRKVVKPSVLPSQ